MFIFSPICCCSGQITPCKICFDHFGRPTGTDLNAFASGCVYTSTNGWSLFSSGTSRHLVTTGNNILGLPGHPDNLPNLCFMTTRPFSIYSGLGIRIHMGDYYAEYNWITPTSVYLTLNGPDGLLNTTSLLQYPVRLGIVGGAGIDTESQIFVGMTDIYVRPDSSGTWGSRGLTALGFEVGGGGGNNRIVMVENTSVPSNSGYLRGDFQFFAGFADEHIMEIYGINMGNSSGFYGDITNYLSATLESIPSVSNIELEVFNTSNPVNFSGFYIGKTTSIDDVNRGFNFANPTGGFPCMSFFDDCTCLGQNNEVYYANNGAKNNTYALGYSAIATNGSWIESTGLQPPGNNPQPRVFIAESVPATLEFRHHNGWPVLDSQASYFFTPSTSGLTSVRLDLGYNDEGAEYIYAIATWPYEYDETYPHIISSTVRYKFKTLKLELYSSAGGLLSNTEQMFAWSGINIHCVSNISRWINPVTTTLSICYSKNGVARVNASVPGFLDADSTPVTIDANLGYLTGKGYRKNRVHVLSGNTGIIIGPINNPIFFPTRKMGSFDGSATSIYHGIARDQIDFGSTTRPYDDNQYAITGKLDCGACQGGCLLCANLPDSIFVTLSGFLYASGTVGACPGFTNLYDLGNIVDAGQIMNWDGEYELVKKDTSARRFDNFAAGDETCTFVGNDAPNSILVNNQSLFFDYCERVYFEDGPVHSNYNSAVCVGAGGIATTVSGEGVKFAISYIEAGNIPYIVLMENIGYKVALATPPFEGTGCTIMYSVYTLATKYFTVFDTDAPDDVFKHAYKYKTIDRTHCSNNPLNSWTFVHDFSNLLGCAPNTLGSMTGQFGYYVPSSIILHW